MLNIYTPQEAQESVLKRVPLDDLPVPQRLLDSIKSVFGKRLSPEEAVHQILQEIRDEGDRALRRWSARLDGLDTMDFRVSAEKIKSAWHLLPEKQQNALQHAAARIKNFHQHQPLQSWEMSDGKGILGQLVRPIHRVGIYVPAGTAPLPSTVLMSVIPAQVAGVQEIVLMVPPDKTSGEIAPVVLASAGLLGIEEIYTLGGAQAIGALAFGAESIPAVDKIFGPGNLFVTLAKRQVFGMVGIDGLAGPTETMVIADDSANPEWVAADLLAQAEHDVLASAILLTPSRHLAKLVQAAVANQMESLPRAEIVVQSLNNRSGIVITRDLAEAVGIANKYAPEHLCLSVEHPLVLSDEITSAGGIFVGEYSCEVLGDYVAGPSHVMPTSGTAKFASPLNVWDFVHLVSLIALDEAVSERLSDSAAQIARSEGLEAHARAADFRRKEN